MPVLEKLKKNNIIGLRTVKTLLAVILSTALMHYVFRQNPFFACIGAVVAMDRTMASSIKSSIIRNVGTITGGLIGILMTYIVRETVLLTLGIVPFIIVNNKLKRHDSIVPGAIVYFAVVFLNTTGQAAFTYGITRILGTLIGSVIGLLVNYFVFRPKPVTTEPPSSKDS